MLLSLKRNLKNTIVGVMPEWRGNEKFQVAKLGARFLWTQSAMQGWEQALVLLLLSLRVAHQAFSYYSVDIEQIQG